MPILVLLLLLLLVVLVAVLVLLLLLACKRPPVEAVDIRQMLTGGESTTCTWAPPTILTVVLALVLAVVATTNRD
jgi:hypothetical protein